MNFKEAIKEIFKTAANKFNIQKAPSLHFHNDEENAEKLFGRTAYYNPSDESIVLYITNRHPKDILRSFCHELIHHVQNERGDLELGDASSPNYAQEDDHMRKMEKEAYLEGNLLLRDFEDNYKNKIKEYRGTGASGGNSTDGNDITSPRPFADDKEEIENYTNKNVHGGEGNHYRKEPAFKNPNRTRFGINWLGGSGLKESLINKNMKKSDIHKLIQECINEVLNEKRKRYGQHDYYGNNVGGRNSISGYPGVWEEEKKEEKEIEILDDADVEEVEILDDVEDIENVTININEEDALVTRGKKIIQILNKPEYKKFKPTFNDFIKDRTKGKFSLPNKIDDKTDGDILALLNLRAKDFSNIFK